MADGTRVRWDVRVYRRLASTNATLRELAAAGASDGTVVAAGEQTAGRGRHGRSWSSPAGAGLYVSLLVRPRLEAREVQTLTFVAAVAVAETLEGLGVGGVEIKWPNDVLVRGRKVCGVLTEASFLDGRLDWAVVGIGVNLTAAAVPPDPLIAATSLEAEGVAATNIELLGLLLGPFGRWYETLAERGPADVVARWEALAPMARGAAVTVDDGREVYEAVTEGVTADGHLRVRRRDGEARDLAAADVTLGAKAG
jgi:BirA family biotin operon repressor/biotin-[acetyl-CoA-carboxylase] ligase